jgi:hypothetical protein
MILEDARNLTAAAVQALREQTGAMDAPQLRITLLPDFLEAAKAAKLTRAEREVICEQAMLVVDQFYVHLPFKRARYAVDPVQRLRLLHAQLGQMDDDLAFHSELLRVFNEMRDAHTFYGLPEPYKGAMAFLPFFLQSYVDEAGRRRYVVTNVLTGFAHPHFQPGVEVTYWNGMPVQRAVERLAEEIPAGNPASKFLRGMMRMTVRSLTYALPPDEELVFVQYTPREDDDAIDDRVIAMPWSVATGMTGEQMQFRASGICEPVADHAAARQLLWGQQQWLEQAEFQEQERAESPIPVYPSLAAVPQELREDPALFSTLPAVFDFQHPAGVSIQGSITPDELTGTFNGVLKRFGYIRIRSFGARSDTLFNEFRRILTVMNEKAPDGLVLDVRGNPGGSISGAERMLQLLTPREITPSSFHLANTPTIQEILGKIIHFTSDDAAETIQILKLKADFAAWIQDSAEAVASGKLMTDGHPLTSPVAANDTGQVYQGPVSLLIDSASYSATDIFASGFQDHGIGPIIGVDENTGGGGASRWLHRDDLFDKLKSISGMPLQPLPREAAIGFAVLRSSRVGKFAGYPIEDVGVKRDILRRLTKKDLMDWGSDLVEFACAELAGRPVYRLVIADAAFTAEGLRVTVETGNLDRLVCFLDGQPRHVVNAGEATFTIPIDVHDREARTLTIYGHAWTGARTLELAVAARRDLTA